MNRWRRRRTWCGNRNSRIGARGCGLTHAGHWVGAINSGRLRCDDAGISRNCRGCRRRVARPMSGWCWGSTSSCGGWRCRSCGGKWRHLFGRGGRGGCDRGHGCLRWHVHGFSHWYRCWSRRCDSYWGCTFRGTHGWRRGGWSIRCRCVRSRTTLGCVRISTTLSRDADRGSCRSCRYRIRILRNTWLWGCWLPQLGWTHRLCGEDRLFLFALLLLLLFLLRRSDARRTSSLGWALYHLGLLRSHDLRVTLSVSGLCGHLGHLLRWHVRLNSRRNACTVDLLPLCRRLLLSLLVLLLSLLGLFLLGALFLSVPALRSFRCRSHRCGACGISSTHRWHTSNRLCCGSARPSLASCRSCWHGGCGRTLWLRAIDLAWRCR